MICFLVSSGKARRLWVLRAAVGVGVSTNEDGVRIYKIGGERTVTEADAEHFHMASYLFDGNTLLGEALRVGFTADCSTCSASDTLTVAAYTSFFRWF